MSSIMLLISLLLLGIVGMTGVLSPIMLYLIMLLVGVILIGFFSNINELIAKLKLFLFFFSLYFIYTLAVHYILVDDNSNILGKIYVDEQTLYDFSNRGLDYISGDKNFFDIFSVYSIDELPLHVVFMSLIAYFSINIDSVNIVLSQKLLAPFFGGLFSVVLYSTIKHEFKNTTMSFNATMAYGLLSAIFMFSTPMLRDIDVALAYMVFFYLFLQKTSLLNILSMLIIAFGTYFLRNESGIVLFALTILSLFFSVKELRNKGLRIIIYLVLFTLFLAFVYLSAHIILAINERFSGMSEGRSALIAAESAKSSLSKLFNNLPFGLSHSAKLIFGQIQPFPLLNAINTPLFLIHGIFWPFIFTMMIYGIIYKQIREKINIKIKYLLAIAISILFLMSAEPTTRRMLSVYPIIYMVSLYVFLTLPRNKIKRLFYYYISAIIILNTFYYYIKV